MELILGSFLWALIKWYLIGGVFALIIGRLSMWYYDIDFVHSGAWFTLFLSSYLGILVLIYNIIKDLED